MAKIWPVYEGSVPTLEPWAVLQFSEATALFELRPEDFVADLQKPPRFGSADRDLTFAGFKHIVVEVNRKEAKPPKWNAGFYKSRVRPKEAFGRLLRQALSSELGSENVVRVDWRPATDSQGRDALQVTVVIAPNVVRNLKGESILNALVKLRMRLHEMHDERTPIVEYATEAELAQDASR